MENSYVESGPNGSYPVRPGALSSSSSSSLSSQQTCLQACASFRPKAVSYYLSAILLLANHLIQVSDLEPKALIAVRSSSIDRPSLRLQLLGSDTYTYVGHDCGFVVRAWSRDLSFRQKFCFPFARLASRVALFIRK